MKRMHQSQSATDMIQETTANYAMMKCKGFYIGWFSQSSADSLLLQVPWSWQLFGFNTGAMRFLLFRVLQLCHDWWLMSDEGCSFRVAAPILCSWCRCQEFAAWNSSSCTLLDACVAWSQIPDGRTGTLLSKRSAFLGRWKGIFGVLMCPVFTTCCGNAAACTWSQEWKSGRTIGAKNSIDCMDYTVCKKLSFRGPFHEGI